MHPLDRFSHNETPRFPMPDDDYSRQMDDELFREGETSGLAEIEKAGEIKEGAE